jgi:hypothetical protein
MKHDDDIPTTDTTEVKRLIERVKQGKLDQDDAQLIEFTLFDATDELLDLGRISGGDVIVVFGRRRSRRSYARQKRTPRPERKYFLFSRGSTAGTLSSTVSLVSNALLILVAQSSHLGSDRLDSPVRGDHKLYVKEHPTGRWFRCN